MQNTNFSYLLSTERRSCLPFCLHMLSWGVEVCSPLWEGSPAARQDWSRTSWRRTERSAHLLETLLSPHSSYTSTSTHVTLCLIMGKNLCNEPFILHLSTKVSFTSVNTHTSLHIYWVLMNINYTNRSAFFLGEIDKPAQGILQRAKRKAVNVGICLEGVYVMDVKEKVSAGLKTIQCHVSHFVYVHTWIIVVHTADMLKAVFISLHEKHFSLSCSTCCWACVSMSFPGTTATPRGRGTRTFCGWSLMERKTALLSTSC